MNKIFVATPAYDGKFNYSYLKSAIEFSSSKDTFFTFSYIFGDSLLPKARSSLLSAFYDQIDSLEFTHMLWLDSDVYLPIEGLEKMLSRDVDVISAAIPIKESISEYGIKVSCGKISEEVEDMLYIGEYGATGALLIKTQVVKDLIKYASENDLIFAINDYDTGRSQNLFDLFRIGIEDKEYLSEDIYFCKKIVEIGYPIYIDTSFYVEHSDDTRLIWSRGPTKMNPGILESGSPKRIKDDGIENFCVPSCI